MWTQMALDQGHATNLDPRTKKMMGRKKKQKKKKDRKRIRGEGVCEFKEYW
jgi:hypothetical protein